jgi:hypothetical protein
MRARRSAAERIRGLLWAVALVACGCASSGGGIGGSGLVVGVIEGTDGASITVDGITFDASVADVTLDGDPGDAAGLKPGMVVTVEGEIDDDTATGVADAIRYESLLRGPVDAIRPLLRELTVLESRIVLEPDVVLDGIVFDSTLVDTGIEISGFIDAAGDLRATRIAPSDGSDTEFLLFGLVRNLDADAETFSLRTLDVDYSSAIFVGGEASDLADGGEVRVRFSERPVGGLIVADTVILRPPTIGDGGRRGIRTLGFVTELRSSREIVLDQRFVVRLRDDTVFIGGGPADLAVDRLVGIVGRVGRDRVIIASVVVLRRPTADSEEISRAEM